jgi:hypothetical protein
MRFPNLGLLLLLALTALIAASGKPVPNVETVEQGPSVAARSNALLALGRLAERLGASVEMHAQLPDGTLPPANGGVLWLPVPGTVLGEKRSSELLAWVKAGGTLVIAPRQSERWKDDPLAGAAGLEFVQIEEESAAQDDAAASDDDQTRRSEENTTGAKAPAEEGALASANTCPVYDQDMPDTPYALDDTWSVLAEPRMDRFVSSTAPGAANALCDAEGCHAVRVPLGNGAVLALADPDLFANDRLDYLDHALLARHFLALQQGTTLWLIYEERVPTLFELIWQHAKAALFSTLAALLLWLLAAAARVGPALPSPQPVRRRLTEHVEAVGLLLARQGAYLRLWRAVHDDVINTLHRRHPQIRGAADAARMALIARHTGMDASNVRLMLMPPDNAAGLEEALRRLDTLRKTL